MDNVTPITEDQTELVPPTAAERVSATQRNLGEAQRLLQIAQKEYIGALEQYHAATVASFTEEVGTDG